MDVLTKYYVEHCILFSWQNVLLSCWALCVRAGMWSMYLQLLSIGYSNGLWLNAPKDWQEAVLPWKQTEAHLAYIPSLLLDKQPAQSNNALTSEGSDGCKVREHCACMQDEAAHTLQGVLMRALVIQHRQVSIVVPLMPSGCIKTTIMPWWWVRYGLSRVNMKRILTLELTLNYLHILDIFPH